jgi:hypothetical protein
MSVYRAFEQAQDGRHKRGVRYSVAQILTLVALGKLVGMTTPAAIAEWVRLRAEWLKQIVAWARPTFPCASTYSNVLRTLDAEQVNQVLAQFVIRVASTRRFGEEPSRLLSPGRGRSSCPPGFRRQDASWHAGTCRSRSTVDASGGII